MTAPLADPDADDTLLVPSGQSRWGVRLRELKAEASPGATSTPLAPVIEPLEWQPKPSFWERFRRGAAIPTAAAAVVFIAIVLISVTTALLRPHALDESGALVKTASASGALAGTEGNFASTDRTGSDGGGGVPARSVPSQPIVVHVIGEVQRPGVYELPPESRALAAIEAAGGATEEAILSALNLARLLSDGEQLLVPNDEHLEASAASGVASENGAIPGASAASSGLVSLNAADLSALESLPRVGPALAQRILDWRSANGGFQSTDQLLNVAGIGQKTFDQLQSLVTL